MLLLWLDKKTTMNNVVCADLRLPFTLPPAFPIDGGKTVPMLNASIHFSDLPVSWQRILRNAGRRGESFGVEELLVCLVLAKDWAKLRCLTAQLGTWLDRFLWLEGWDLEAENATTKLQVMRANARYLAATRNALSNEQFLSAAVDGSRVGRKKMLMGVVAGACGVAAVLPPQVL